MNMVDVEDLLIEILLRLPPISSLRFQCVSKQWLSIISSSDFRRLSPAVTGLFFAPPTPTGKVNPLPGPHFVALRDENPQRQTLANRLNVLCGGGRIVSLNSCNGLLCVWFVDGNGSNFYVYNPTTNQRRRIPDRLNNNRKRYDVIAMNIAFDPSKSHHYKLVCAYNHKHKRSAHIGFSVYSSESRVWRDSGEKLPTVSFDNRSGAFLNGAIHWYFHRNRFLCFDVDNGCLRRMPCIPLSQGLKPGRCSYFGECGGHLHLIEQCGDHGSRLMNVFEMENDYSEWVFKYQVNLNYLTRFYPIRNDPYEIPGFVAYGFSVHLFVVNDEGKEGLVISFPRKLILYHLDDMSITELAAADDVWPENFNDLIDTSLARHSTCKHIETLAYV